MTAIVSWENVVKNYRGKTALSGFSLDLGPGIHCLLGSNGAGKSTALNILTGTRQPTSGTATVLGQRVVRGGPQARNLSCVPQAVMFPPTLKVREVLRFISVHYPHPLDFAAVQNALSLEGILDQQCGGLSGGQLRRLGIAGAVICNAPVIIMDEPLAGLDIEGRAQVRNIILEQRDLGRCIIMASHDYGEIEATADTVTLVKDGRNILSEDIASVRQRLGLHRLSFSTARPVPPAVLGLGVVEPLGADRYQLVTDDPDAASRVLLDVLDDPKLNVQQSSLEDAVSMILSEEKA
ncbi:ABC-2 type transport system ATP-binding protein [Arthrobacter woluwensis]|uniref:ABC transporter ATP-binding protein n=1 Tax=Arthrobacter woluwensis TaxID=156980 RepID=UPI0027815093|nr:ABC transporter ATP-binding protein [Arthrobacter woluwensis]MDQ0708359.1 ABC-2 type transport system ATP-binding protein [Arthrobacter woluwensis]